MIVPFPAGGPADLVARVLSAKLHDDIVRALAASAARGGKGWKAAPGADLREFDLPDDFLGEARLTVARYAAVRDTRVESGRRSASPDS